MTTSKLKDGMIGFVVGEALGVPNEFKSRKSLKDNPTYDMHGFGSHPVPAGIYSDGTSLILGCIDSINTKKGINYKDMMESIVKWAKNAKYSASNYVFNISETCVKAITNYTNLNMNPIKCGLNEEDNTSLMRMLPLAYYAYYKFLQEDEIYELVKKTSSLTNKNDKAVLGCYLYVRYIMCLLGGKNKEKSYDIIKKLDLSYFSKKSIKAYKRILESDISLLKIKDISSSDNVVSSLEAALWCFLKADSYEMSVIAAINLGDDTDTIGALTGSFAGIFYGYKKIRLDWINKIVNIEFINKIIDEYEITLKEKNLFKQLSLTL